MVLRSLHRLTPQALRFLKVILFAKSLVIAPSFSTLTQSRPKTTIA